MSLEFAKILQTLTERFSAQPCDFCMDNGLILSVDTIVDACRVLRDEFGFDLFSAVTATDYWPEETPRFHVIYLLYSIPHQSRISLRVPVNGNEPKIPTLEGVYPNANWYERELWDMFGIVAEGHSDLRRIVLPYDWVGHPLRKDYPLGYEEVQFSFNYDEIQQRKHRGGLEEA